MLSALIYFLIGAGLGIITGIPLGPANFAVVDAAYRHHVRRAVAVALGAATADCAYAMIGARGIGPKILEYPVIKTTMFVISGLVLILYGLHTVRQTPVDPTAEPVDAAPKDASLLRGYLLGVVLIILNPGPLLFWVLIFGTHFGDATTLEGTSSAIGVGVGSAIWFCFIAWAADHGKRLLGSRAVWIGRVVGIVLMGAGALAFSRGIWAFVKEIL